MNTPIVKISDDQNEITHKSGVVTEFVEGSNCKLCIYYEKIDCWKMRMPCDTFQRKDKKMGKFKLKQP